MGLTRNTLLQRPECSREKVWNRVKISATFTVGGSLYPELRRGWEFASQNLARRRLIELSRARLGCAVLLSFVNEFDQSEAQYRDEQPGPYGEEQWLTSLRSQFVDLGFKPHRSKSDRREQIGHLDKINLISMWD